VRSRRISEEQLFTALLGQESQGRLIGDILIGDGSLSEAALHEALREKAEETVYDLFLWSEGRFDFREGELPEKVLFFVEMRVQGVILEGIRRVDEWQRIRKAFPSMRTSFKLKGAPLVEDAAERRVLGLVASGKTLAEISLELHQTEFETAFGLYDLYVRDLIEVDRVEPEPAGDPVARIKELLALGYQRLQEKRFEEALKAYEEVLGVDRLNQNAKKGLVAVAEARARERALKSVPLQKVPFLTRDLISLTREKLDPQEGFLLSRVNGQWDVRSILKLCPMGEEDALLIFARLLDRGLIELRDP
jgi:hypothetical protein